MEDKREQILQRLADLLKGVADANGGTFHRNVAQVQESELPAIQLFDGDEVADETAASRGRPPTAPNIVTMTPEVFVTLAEDPEPIENVGTRVSRWRARVIKAVLSDEQLRKLCHNNDVRYDGCATALSRGREVTGESGISFALPYVLRPAEL
ncbi:hypothetical protein ACJMQP_04145 [Rhodopseudomonas palustris]